MFWKWKQNGKSYRKILANHTLPRFNYLREDAIFLQEGASLHFSNRVKSYLNNKQQAIGLAEVALFRGHLDLLI